MKRLFTPERKRVIFFDMNQTLLDPDSAYNESFIEVLQEYTDRWFSVERDGIARQALAKFHSEYNSRAGSKKRTSASRLQLRQSSLAAALKPLPLPQEPSFIQSLLQRIDARAQQSPKLFPGVLDTLEYLAPRYRLAIISNGRREKQERHLTALGLDKFFPPEHLFTSQQKDKRKPHAAIFVHAMQAMKVTPKQALMVGNSWPNDVIGALRAGMDAIWLNPGHKDKSSLRKIGSKKVAVIRKLEQLTVLL
nr:HAD family hydrolase [Aneurinibacillus sp. XH2]